MPENKSPLVRTVSLTLPTLQDNIADADRFSAALKKTLCADHVKIDLAVLQRLPDLLRQERYRLDCLVVNEDGFWKVIHVCPATSTETMAGLAVDLGTTRVSLRLIDLMSGESLAETSFINPQVSVAPDILARIHFAETPNGLATLTDLIVDAINTHLKKICAAVGLPPHRVYLVSLAGNTTMTHFVMGLNPRWIIREPYIPVVNHIGFRSAAVLGLCVNPGARIFLFPSVGSYFGGDLIAGILYSGIYQREAISLLVDVGDQCRGRRGQP